MWNIPDLYLVVCVSSSARVHVLALWLMFSVLQTSTRFVSSRERTASTTSTWSSTGRTSRAVRSRCVWENRDRAGMLDSSLLTVPVWNEEPQVTHRSLTQGWTILRAFPVRRQPVFSSLWILIAPCFCWPGVWRGSRVVTPSHSRWTHLLSQQNGLQKIFLMDQICLHCNSSRGRESVKLSETFNPAQKVAALVWYLEMYFSCVRLKKPTGLTWRKEYVRIYPLVPADDVCVNTTDDWSQFNRLQNRIQTPLLHSVWYWV